MTAPPCGPWARGAPMPSLERRGSSSGPPQVEDPPPARGADGNTPSLLSGQRMWPSRRPEGSTVGHSECPWPSGRDPGFCRQPRSVFLCGCWHQKLDLQGTGAGK